MQDYFFAIAKDAFESLRGSEIASFSFNGESSSFARFNRAKLRQPGDVEQRVARVSLIRGARHATFQSSLSGDRSSDLALLVTALADARSVLDSIPDDPHLLYDTEPREMVRVEESELPEPHDAALQVLSLAEGHDFVGLWASGALHRGLATSLGHRFWQTSHSFNLDFSLYAERDKAAKGAYAGTRLDVRALADRIARAAGQVEILRRPEKRIEPGDYRVYLAPSAVGEIFGMLAWDAFSVKMHRTKQTPFLRMMEQGLCLDPRLSLIEDAASGVAPRFLQSGFVRPERVALITEGRVASALVSPRSAREYGLEVNAGANERPTSLVMAAGGLAEADVLSRLGTGLYVTNLWYTNYSDLSAGRITGMTRFATTWVENGKPVSPLAVMRFDDTLLRMVGSELEALTSEREWMLDSSTYGERSTDSSLLPGALIKAMTFTL